MLCIDYPAEILHGILRLLDKREEENVEFDEFLCGIKTILTFDNFFEEMEGLFKYLDSKQQGKIKKDVWILCILNKHRSWYMLWKRLQVNLRMSWEYQP